MMENAATLARGAHRSRGRSTLPGTQSAIVPNPEAYPMIGRKSRVPRWAATCERSRRQPLVNLNAISRRAMRWWESVRPPQERARRARGQGWPGTIDGCCGPLDGRDRGKVRTASRLTHRSGASRSSCWRFEPGKNHDPDSDQGAATPCPIKERFSHHPRRGCGSSPNA